jgi:hypothetical protein
VCCQTEIADHEVLREAGRIRVKLRKTNGGGRPVGLYQCKYCAVLQHGRGMLRDHETVCDRRPKELLFPISDAEVAAMAWFPE